MRGLYGNENTTILYFAHFLVPNSISLSKRTTPEENLAYLKSIYYKGLCHTRSCNDAKFL